MATRSSFELSKQGGSYKRWFFKKFNEQKGKCLECGVSMYVPRTATPKGNTDCMATVDHIIALKDGGGNGHQNLQIVCSKCNKLKN